VQGNQPGPCFSRQVSMYVAKNVGGWSTTRIGRFYNGRHHATVLRAIAKIERLRKDDESVDALIEVLTAVLTPRMEGQFSQRFEPGWSMGLIEAVAARYWTGSVSSDRCRWPRHPSEIALGTVTVQQSQPNVRRLGASKRGPCQAKNFSSAGDGNHRT